MNICFYKNMYDEDGSLIWLAGKIYKILKTNYAQQYYEVESESTEIPYGVSFKNNSTYYTIN